MLLRRAIVALTATAVAAATATGLAYAVTLPPDTVTPMSGASVVSRSLDLLASSSAGVLVSDDQTGSAWLVPPTGSPASVDVGVDRSVRDMSAQLLVAYDYSGADTQVAFAPISGGSVGAWSTRDLTTGDSLIAATDTGWLVLRDGPGDPQIVHVAAATGVEQGVGTLADAVFAWVGEVDAAGDDVALAYTADDGQGGDETRLMTGTLTAGLTVASVGSCGAGNVDALGVSAGDMVYLRTGATGPACDTWASTIERRTLGGVLVASIPLDPDGVVEGPAITAAATAWLDRNLDGSWSLRSVPRAGGTTTTAASNLTGYNTWPWVAGIGSLFAAPFGSTVNDYGVHTGPDAAGPWTKRLSSPGPVNSVADGVTVAGTRVGWGDNRSGYGSTWTRDLNTGAGGLSQGPESLLQQSATGFGMAIAGTTAAVNSANGVTVLGGAAPFTVGQASLIGYSGRWLWVKMTQGRPGRVYDLTNGTYRELPFVLPLYGDLDGDIAAYTLFDGSVWAFNAATGTTTALDGPAPASGYSDGGYTRVDDGIVVWQRACYEGSCDGTSQFRWRRADGSTPISEHVLASTTYRWDYSDGRVVWADEPHLKAFPLTNPGATTTEMSTDSYLLSVELDGNLVAWIDDINVPHVTRISAAPGTPAPPPAPAPPAPAPAPSASTPPAALPPAVAPSAPTAVKAKVKGAKVKVSWKAPTTGQATGYLVQVSTNKKKWKKAGTTSGATTLTWSKGKKGATYYLRVAATSTAGQGAFSGPVKARLK